MPGRTKEVEWFGEAVIVDEASVHGEYAHEQDQVAPAEKGVPDLQGEKAVPVTRVPADPSIGGLNQQQTWLYLSVYIQLFIENFGSLRPSVYE